MAKITTWKDIWDFSNLTDINKALKVFGKLDKVYEGFIALTKKAATQITANNAALVKSLDSVAASSEKLNATNKSHQKEIQETNAKAKALSATYSSQNKQIAALEAQVKKLTKERSNVAKKTTDLNNINKKAIALEAQIGQLTGKTAKETASLRLQKSELTKTLKREAQETAGLVTLYQKESATLVRLRSELKDLILQEKGATTQGKALAAQVATLDARLKGADAAAGQFQRNVGGYTQALGRLKVGFTQVAGALGFTGLIFGLVSAFKSSFNTIRNFQKENAVLAGVLNKSRDEITELTEDAKILGATTAKSATEVNKLQIAYARLGFTQAEILELTADTINGSIALNAELDETAELTGALVRTFDELGTTDAASILDTLTASTQQSALNFKKLQTGLPIVAGAANAAGISFTRTVALLGKLSDAGIDASSSSTALRNIFIEAAAQGLNYEEILIKIANSQDKLTAANDEFGKRGAVSASILANLVDEVNDFDVALNNAGGTASKVASENLDTLSGSITLLSSAWEGFILGLEDGTGVLSSITKNLIDFGAAALNAFSSGNFAPKVDELKEYNRGLDEGLSIIKELSSSNSQFFNVGDQSDALLRFSNRLDDANLRLKEFRAENVKNGVVSIRNASEYRALRDEVQFLEGVTDSLTGKISNQVFEFGSLNESLSTTTGLTEDQEKAIRDLSFAYDDLQVDYNELQSVLDDSSKRLIEFNNLLESITTLDSSSVSEWANEDAEALKNATDKADEYYNSIREGEEKAAIIRNTAFEATSILANQKFENDSIRRDNEIASLQTQKDRELEIAGDNEQKKAAIEASFAEKERQIRIKQAKANKKQALFNIAINTAQAILQAIAQFGPPPSPLGIAGIAAAGLIGVTQAAAVVSAPLPAFEDGGTVTTDGAIITSEKGYEYAVTPKGELIKTGSNGAEIRTDIPKGSEILTHAMSKQLDSGLFNKTLSHEDSNNSIQEYIKRDKIQTAQIIANTLKVENDHLAKVFNKAIKDLPEIHQFRFSHGKLIRNVSKGNTTRRDWKSKNND